MHDPSLITVADATMFIRDLADCQALRPAIGHADARALEAVRRLWAREGFAHLGAEELEMAAGGHVPMLDDPGMVAALVAGHVRHTHIA